MFKNNKKRSNNTNPLGWPNDLELAYSFHQNRNKRNKVLQQMTYYTL